MNIPIKTEDDMQWRIENWSEFQIKLYSLSHSLLSIRPNRIFHFQYQGKEITDRSKS